VAAVRAAGFSRLDILPAVNDGDSRSAAHAALTVGSRTPGGVLPACPAAMFTAALVSALQVKPQLTQQNTAWLSREFLLIHPQALQRRLV